MNSLYNGEDNASTRYFMPPSKTSSARNGLQCVELLDKGFPQIPKCHLLFPRLWHMFHNLIERLLNTALTYIIQHGGIKPVPNWKFHLCWPEFLMLEGPIHASRKIIMSITQLQTLWPTTVTCQQDTLGQQLHKRYVSNDHFLVGLKAHSMSWSCT